MMPRAFLLAALVACFSSGAAARERSQEAASLAAARALYGQAAYQEALDMLDRLKQAHPPLEQLLLVEKNRAFCLLALGRASEARQAFAALLIARPTFRLGEDEVSGRVLETFRDVRRETLPAALARAFQAARRSYEYQQWDAAAREFEEVIALAGDPDMPRGSGHAPEVAELARGYLDLLAAKRPPVAARSLSGFSTLPSAGQEVFSEHDPEVTPPEPIDERFPPWPALLRNVQASGVVEVVIDEEGGVESASMLQPAHPVYDQLLLEAAKSWRYRPARRGDAPVKYMRRIRVVNDARSGPDQPAPATAPW